MKSAHDRACVASYRRFARACGTLALVLLGVAACGAHEDESADTEVEHTMSVSEGAETCFCGYDCYGAYCSCEGSDACCGGCCATAREHECCACITVQPKRPALN